MKSVRKLIALAIWALVAVALETPAQAAEGRPKKDLVFILAENEYQAWRTIPEFGQMLEDKYGFQCEYLTSSPVLVMAGREGGLAATLASHGAKEGGKVTDKMVSSAFEAMVGALYEKESYQAAVRLIDNFLLVDEYVSGSFNGKGAITELKELGDRDREMKVTHSTSERIEDGVTIYSHVTTVNGKASKGEGRTKKGAEARAAARALADVLPYVPK